MTGDDGWLDPESEALGRKLIDAGRAERPSPMALAKTVAALGAGAAVTAATAKAGAAAAAASAAGAALGGSAGSSVPIGTSAAAAGVLLSKWLVGAAVLGVATFGAVELVNTPAPVVAPREAPVLQTMDAEPLPPKPPSPSAPVEVAPAPLEPSDAPPAPSARPRRVTSKSEPVAIPTAGPGATSEPRSQLEEELALIDEARALLDAGRARSALDKLSEHQGRFTSGGLGPEALFLRMQAHQRLGNDAEARRAAERIIERSPDGPHAGSARELLKR